MNSKNTQDPVAVVVRDANDRAHAVLLDAGADLPHKAGLYVAATASADPFEALGAEIEWDYRDDDHRTPREFWHARVSFRGFVSEWERYGKQEQRELPEDVKARAEAKLRAQFNVTFQDRPAAPVSAEPVGWMREDELARLPFMCHVRPKRPAGSRGWVPVFRDAPVAPQAAFSVSVRGVGIIDDNQSALAVYFNAAPSGQDIRALHNIVTSAPVAAPGIAEPVGEIVLFGGDSDLKEVSWRNGKMPPPGTKLYTAPVAAQAQPQWQPIDTAPKDNSRLLYLARFQNGELAELDFNGSWEYWSESWELDHINGWAWTSNNGIEEPTHWAYQDEPLPTVAAQAQPLPDSLIPTAPDLEYLRSMSDSTNLPAALRGQIAAAVNALEGQARLESAELQEARHDSAHAETESERVRALAYWLRQQTYEPEMLSCAADTLLVYLEERNQAQQDTDRVDAEHIQNLIEVSRMPNIEHVADAHNAAVRHLRSAIDAARKEAGQ